MAQQVVKGNELPRSSLERAQTIKGNGQAYRNPLTLHVPGALRYTSPGCVAQVLGGGLGVDVAKANRSVQRLVSVQAAKTVHPVHPVRASGVGVPGRIGVHGRSEVALTLNGQQGSLGDKRRPQLLAQLVRRPAEPWGRRRIDPCHS